MKRRSVSKQRNVTDIELNEQFLRAYEEMELTDHTLFITGKAGTGKSTLLQYFRQNTQKNVAILAPTGVAAIHVAGQTIHSFFRFGIDITPETVTKRRMKENLYAKLDTIVIDEVSMVRADLMDCIDRFLRLHGPHEGEPFGGIQLICIGDLYQLPPVISQQESEYFFDTYQSPYFFDARAFQGLPYSVLELDKIYRQSDTLFIDILNAIRQGDIKQEMLDIVNNRLDLQFDPSLDDTYISLTTTNNSADAINARNLARIPGKCYTFEGQVDGDFKEKEYPVPYNLALKEGAQVMMVVNDKEGRWVNGTLAKISRIEDGEIYIRLEDGSEELVEQNTWEKYQYRYDEETKKVKSEVVGLYTQFPIRLAWAITIHKSQGKTFDKVIIDFGRGTFAHGQAYVALSRCRSLEGIILRSKLSSRDIFIEDRVIDFLS